MLLLKKSRYIGSLGLSTAAALAEDHGSSFQASSCYVDQPRHARTQAPTFSPLARVLASVSEAVVAFVFVKCDGKKHGASHFGGGIAISRRE